MIDPTHQPAIIAFTKDWDDVPTCTTHILHEMARTRQILWVNSIGTRKPRLNSPSDIRRLFRRLAGYLRRPVTGTPNIRVLSPLLIPQARSAASRAINRLLFRLQAPISRPATPEYWCFVPNAVDLIPPGAFTVYVCVDDWSTFHNLDGAWLDRREQDLLQRADIVFAVSRFLVEKCRRVAGNRVHYSPHGVAYNRFHDGAQPDRFRPSPRPVIGFYGNLHAWVDFDLIEQLAHARPQWDFILIGEWYADVSALRACANVTLTGRREHAELPAYCSTFSAAIIPYDMRQERMQSVNPVKTLELLAAGVPVVASDIPELHGMSPDIILCRTRDEWLTALDAAIQRTDHLAISNRVADADWSSRVQTLRTIVEATRRDWKSIQCSVFSVQTR